MVLDWMTGSKPTETAAAVTKAVTALPGVAAATKATKDLSVEEVLRMAQTASRATPAEAAQGVAAAAKGSQKGGAAPSFAGCFIPGFEFMESNYLPQGIVLPSAVFMYILSDFVASKRPASLNIGVSILPVAIVISQAMVMLTQGCLKYYYFSKRWGGVGGALATVIFAWALGMLAGYISYTIVNAVDPSRLPSRAPERFENKKTTLIPGVKPQAEKDAEKSKQKSFPPSDEDQFVCDAYRNGELVTSTLVG
jgi:hypothetical protein